ncbi:MAG: CDP-alcohol phosphatidyltransferase family protein [Actinomycetota bacterium]|nr:CDP-alcohol phosphatidyltransferase family protein [Actinomycetota bacterium]
MRATTRERPGAPVPRGAKKLDYWWTVLFTDPIAVPLANLLVRRRWLTANQVSAVALVLGLSVGVVFAFGTRASLIAGGILFYLAFIVDCVDGKVARALNTTSRRGEALDKLADGGRRAAASIGLTLWLWRAETGSDDSLWWAGDGVPENAFLWAVVYAVLAYYFLEVSGENETRRRSWSPETDTAPSPREWSAALARRRLLPNPGMPDVQALVFIIGPITGLVVPAVWLGATMVVAGIGMNVARSFRR